MTNLTQPRYLVIAEDTSGNWKKDNIIELAENYPFSGFTIEVKGNMYGSEMFANYPHLFRLLHWWEYRDEKEMGGYFIGKWRGDAYYIKVDNWVKEGTIFNAKVGDINFVADYCTPITESQYNEYIKNK